MTYRIRIRRSAQKALAGIEKRRRTDISKAIENLADDPRPPSVRKLRDRDGWRIRVGDYRVIYEIREEELVIAVVAIGHRREVYS